MSRKKGTKIASDGGPELTSAGVPWSEVPGFARPDVAWIDGEGRELAGYLAYEAGLVRPGTLS